MALEWNFKTDKIGTWEETNYCGERIKYNLYSGNALLIACYENKEKDICLLTNFFLHKLHMNNCLGLNKGYSNIYSGVIDLVLTLDANYKYTKDIAAAFAKANFDNEITIKIMPKAPF